MGEAKNALIGSSLKAIGMINLFGKLFGANAYAPPDVTKLDAITEAPRLRARYRRCQRPRMRRSRGRIRSYQLFCRDTERQPKELRRATLLTASTTSGNHAPADRQIESGSQWSCRRNAAIARSGLDGRLL